MAYLWVKQKELGRIRLCLTGHPEIVDVAAWNQSLHSQLSHPRVLVRNVERGEWEIAQKVGFIQSTVLRAGKAKLLLFLLSKLLKVFPKVIKEVRVKVRAPRAFLSFVGQFWIWPEDSPTLDGNYRKNI